MTRVEHNMQRRLREASPASRNNKLGPGYANREADSLGVPRNGSSFVQRKLKDELSKFHLEWNPTAEMFMGDCSLMGSILYIYVTTIAKASSKKDPQGPTQKYHDKDITGVYFGVYLSEVVHGTDESELWKPSIVKFFESCGLQKTSLNIPRGGQPNDDVTVYGFNIYKYGDNESINKLVKALHKMNTRMPKAQASWDATRGMDDEAYAKYKGLIPSGDENVKIEWQCGTADYEITYIDSPSSNDKVLYLTSDYGDEAKLCLDSCNWKRLVSEIWDVTDIYGLIDNSDTEDLCAYMDERYNCIDPEEGGLEPQDTLDALKDWVEDRIVDFGGDTSGKLSDPAQVVAICNAINSFLEEFDFVTKTAGAKAFRPTNAKRKHRIAANPSLKAYGEAKKKLHRSMNEAQFKFGPKQEAEAVARKLLDKYWDEDSDDETDNYKLCDQLVVGIFKALCDYIPDASTLFNMEEMEFVMQDPEVGD